MFCLGMQKHERSNNSNFLLGGLMLYSNGGRLGYPYRTNWIPIAICTAVSCEIQGAHIRVYSDRVLEYLYCFCSCPGLRLI